jgi:lysozyme
MLLKNKGFNPGKIDGVMGPKTEQALMNYAKHMLASPGLWPESNAPVVMDDEETALLVKELERDEGKVLHAYKDSLGYLTIGIGRLIDKKRGGGITDAEAHYLKMNDVEKVRRQLDKELPWWRTLDPVRRRALQNMAFQLGIGGLKKFTTSLGYIENGDYQAAGESLRKSLWYQQTPNRAERVVKMIEKGIAE